MPDSSSPDPSRDPSRVTTGHLSAPSIAGPWIVICDFDGTISDVDVTDALLERFALPEWEAIESEWKASLISARECMARQVKLLRVTRPELEAFLDTIDIDAGFRQFIQECRSRRLPVRVVSDGLDCVIRSILRRHNLSQLSVTANQLITTGRNTYELQFPNSRVDCTAASGTCKCANAEQESRDRRVLLIGDGRSDFCLAHNADFVFSKNKLSEYCESMGIPHRDFSGFSDMPFLLSELLDHPHHHVHRQPLSWSLDR
ncbi:MAG: phosphoserine phosphatase [Hydrocarboniphaga sp.]|uniref:MtnX-like HAD-IB family phosphatase n=1 Tax=Hydrocarboniphaga sp. TaxID=2033016 RepID=UPI0026396611|nr:MtnX-like HAD-IB family phosphatase [Hydrocarboniphaga sp.]MDB5972576.1 phosphoserine phosphatase [Hydrocarboniphaga sp.]